MLRQVADDGLDFESLRSESPMAGRIELGVWQMLDQTATISVGPLTDKRRQLDSERITRVHWQQLGLAGLTIGNQISTKLPRRSELADETVPAFGAEGTAVGFAASTDDIQIDRSARPIIRTKLTQHAASYCYGVCGTECAISCAVASDGYQPVKIGIAAEQFAWQIKPMGNGSPFHRTLHGVSP
jgi:hypothetical protein